MVLEEGVRRLGVTPDKLDASQVEVILKRLVYRELQSKMSPNIARGRVEEVLKQVISGSGAKPDKAKAAKPEAASVPENPTSAAVQEAEAGLKRFGLYLDWAEVQNQLEEKLQSSLLRQSRDIADLQAALMRVQNVGGPKVRRLENLIKTIQEAHGQETLAAAEVDRARALAVELRKLVESSVVQSPVDTSMEAALLPDAEAESAIVLDDEEGHLRTRHPTAEVVADDGEIELDLDFDSLSAEQQSRIKEIDVTEDQRRLDGLKEKYAGVLIRPGVSEQFTALQDELIGGNPLGEKLPALEEQLKIAFSEAVSESRVRYEWLADRIGKLTLPPEKTVDIVARLAVIKETLQAGGLPLEIAEINATLDGLEAENAAQKELAERMARLSQAMASVRADAEMALSGFRGTPQVENFMQSLVNLQLSEEAVQTVRQQLSELLGQLSKEREEEGLRRMGLKAAVQAIPALEMLEWERTNLLMQIDQAGAGSLGELQTAVAGLIARAKQIVTSKLDALQLHIGNLERTLKQPLTEFTQSIAAFRQALEQGRISDPAPLERSLQELIINRRVQMGEELARYEMVARSMRGLGGEELETKVIQMRTLLQAGELPDLTEVRQHLVRLRRTQETLRGELSERISTLTQSYDEYKSVGGETVLRLKPLCDFLNSAQARLERLGAGGLLEVRRALEEAELLKNQLLQEFNATKSFMQELKGADLESLLDVFDAPPEAPKTQSPTTGSMSVDDLLAPFKIRGVEAIVLMEGSKVIWGGLPANVQSTQLVFDDLRNLSHELSNSRVQMSVISLPEMVLLLLPLRQKNLVVLAEKALLSRLLSTAEKNRDELNAL
jgi:chromosome segregation protein